MPRREHAAVRGHTWDPWPCCGSPVYEPDWHGGRPKKQQVCPECEELIRLRKDARRRASDAGHETYKWCERHHDWPGYYGAYNFASEPDRAGGDGPWDARDALERRMFELVNAIGRPAEGHAWQSKAAPVLTGTRAEPAHIAVRRRGAGYDGPEGAGRPRRPRRRRARRAREHVPRGQAAGPETSC